jgi:competence protein ComEC
MKYKKHFLFGMLVGIVLLGSFAITLPDGKLHIWFCDVGQGDAAYIRIPGNMDVLIDGGPNDRVLSCLGRHMPFYDRTIDMLVLSHPQQDHLSGLLYVLQRYTVKYFVIGTEGNKDSKTYQELVALIKQKAIPVKNLYRGDVFTMGGVKFTVYWPDKE